MIPWDRIALVEMFKEITLGGSSLFGRLFVHMGEDVPVVQICACVESLIDVPRLTLVVFNNKMC